MAVGALARDSRPQGVHVAVGNGVRDVRCFLPSFLLAPAWVGARGRARTGLLSGSHHGPFGKIEETTPNGPAVAQHPLVRHGSGRGRVNSNYTDRVIPAHTSEFTAARSR
jgi:hypothetical protein